MCEGGPKMMIGGKRLAAAGALAAISILPLAPWTTVAAPASPTSSRHMHINCEYSRLCPDLANPQEVYGSEYVGHDEPSLLFYSDRPGSGNQMQYNMRLPSDPPASNPMKRSYNFELHGAFWFGMALCDTQSFPEQVSTCEPNSDTNIVDPAVSPNHPGTAFMELQFYPPGWVPWPTWAVAVGASSCDPTRWCAAMNVFSLLEDPVNGTFQNASCVAKVGVETFEFAFVTKNGVAQAPANPLDATLTSFTPDKERDLFMKSGDNLQVSIHDTENGVQAKINDLSSGDAAVVDGETALELKAAKPAQVLLFERVWVTDTADNVLSLIDPGTFGSTTTPVGRAPVGISYRAGSVWVANSGDGTVSRIDPRTRKLVATIRVGNSPWGIAVGAGYVWVTVQPPAPST